MPKTPTLAIAIRATAKPVYSLDVRNFRFKALVEDKTALDRDTKEDTKIGFGGSSYETSFT